MAHAAPTFSLDASNPAALDALAQYRGLARMSNAPGDHLDELAEVEREFRDWRTEHRDLVRWDRPEDDEVTEDDQPDDDEILLDDEAGEDHPTHRR